MVWHGYAVQERIHLHPERPHLCPPDAEPGKSELHRASADHRVHPVHWRARWLDPEETGENTNVGGTVNYGQRAFRLGDDAARRQYRAVVSFNTGSLRDDAVVVAVQLKLTRQSVTPAGTSPFSIFKGLRIDVKKGFFGPFDARWSPETSRQVPANRTWARSIRLRQELTTRSASPRVRYPYVNKAGTDAGLTQLRLQFVLDDNNNGMANYISFFSGNHTIASYRPQLLIKYYVVTP